MEKKIQLVTIYIGFFTAILQFIILFLNDDGNVCSVLKEYNTAEFWTVVLSMANLAVLVIFFILINSRPNILRFKPDTLEGIGKYANLLDVMSEGKVHSAADADKYNDRVNRIVLQLKMNISWYALCLMPVYTLFIFESASGPHNWDKAFKIGEDIFNYISSLFLFFAFLVLYNKTLNERNEPAYFKNRYFIAAVLFSMLYGFIYVKFGIPNIYEMSGPVERNELTPEVIVSNRFSLIAGIINSLVMMQLFARYISMEHWAQHERHIKYSSLLTAGVLYLLPVYAVVQPLFGTFHNPIYGDAKTFANCVFAVCLAGKLFFLYVTWLFLKKKVVHLYLHNIITPHNVQQGYTHCFDLE